MKCQSLSSGKKKNKIKYQSVVRHVHCLWKPSSAWGTAEYTWGCSSFFFHYFLFINRLSADFYLLFFFYKKPLPEFVYQNGLADDAHEMSYFLLK